MCVGACVCLSVRAWDVPGDPGQPWDPGSGWLLGARLGRCGQSLTLGGGGAVSRKQEDPGTPESLWGGAGAGVGSGGLGTQPSHTQHRLGTAAGTTEAPCPQALRGGGAAQSKHAPGG